MDRLTVARRSWLMSRVKSKDTSPELAVRRIVFRMGYRYVLHDRRLPGKPDLVFPWRRKIIFVHGCFWHGHRGCKYARLPKTRVSFWSDKVDTNRRRDIRNRRRLRAAAWDVLVVWQCDLKRMDRLVGRLHDFMEE
jgi:DNA mismatch endonuclease (patch repair protein)